MKQEIERMTTIKSIIATLVLLTGVSLSASAQVGELRRNLSVGFNAGANFSNVSFQPTIKQNSLLGMTGGVTARYISEKYFAMICGVQLELNYSQRGWDEKFEEIGDDRLFTHQMNYIEVPFLAHLAFGKDRGMQFFVNLGPQVGFLLNDKEKRSGTWTDSQLASTQYGKKIENKFDYGIAGGAGIEVRTGAGHFLVEGRYYFGLADFYSSTKKDYFSRSAHTTISARITYLFDLRK